MIEEIEVKNKRKDAFKAEQAEIALDTKRFMEVPGNRKFIARLLERTGYMGFCRPEYDLGRRSIGLEIHNALMEVCPDLFLKMQAENTRKKEANHA